MPLTQVTNGMIADQAITPSKLASGSNWGTFPVDKIDFVSGALGAADAGTVEYDGKVIYATPQSAERGLIPGVQYFRLNSTLAGANGTSAQNVLGVGCSLSSSTVYAFDGIYVLQKSAGTTSHNLQLLFGGTATLNNISYLFGRTSSSTSFTDVAAFNALGGFIQVATATTVVSAWTNANAYFVIRLQGTVSVNSGGTFIPQYILSAAPGGAYTAQIGSYFSIYPVSTSGSNTSVGTWA